MSARKIGGCSSGVSITASDTLPKHRVLDFIDALRDHKCLYSSRNPHYFSRMPYGPKQQALQTLSSMFNVTTECVQKRVQSFRTAYKNIKIKEKETGRSGSEGNQLKNTAYRNALFALFADDDFCTEEEVLRSGHVSQINDFNDNIGSDNDLEEPDEWDSQNTNIGPQDNFDVSMRDESHVPSDASTTTYAEKRKRLPLKRNDKVSSATCVVFLFH